MKICEFCEFHFFRSVFRVIFHQIVTELCSTLSNMVPLSLIVMLLAVFEGGTACHLQNYTEFGANSTPTVDCSEYGNCTTKVNFRDEFFSTFDTIPTYNVMAFKTYFEKLALIDNLVSSNNEQKQFFTIFVPISEAFRNWQPIDWGFDPFSVDDFTKSLFLNHIVLGLYDFQNVQNLMLTNVKNNSILVYNSTDIFAFNETVTILGEHKKATWCFVVIDKILLINDNITRELHANNLDKESPPLIVGPWFHSPFLSYVHLLLKDDENISIIMKILEKVSIEDVITDRDYTFFMPIDDAFHKFKDMTNNLDNSIDNNDSNAMSDDFVLENARILLLNHLVHSRIYLKDYVDRNGTFVSLANNSLTLTRDAKSDRYSVNNATIIYDPYYIYNVGTVYFIDSILIPETDEVIINTNLKQ